MMSLVLGMTWSCVTYFMTEVLRGAHKALLSVLILLNLDAILGNHKLHSYEV
jgi:hypothetical protein